MSENACWSSGIGKEGGAQTINVVYECGFGAVVQVVHEIGHAVGFWHEQSRPDHDDYVWINDKCIRDGDDYTNSNS